MVSGLHGARRLKDQAWRMICISTTYAAPAVTRLALAGCSVPQIAAITGHSLKDVEQILDAHYLGGGVELAEAAITKLNAVYG